MRRTERGSKRLGVGLHPHQHELGELLDEGVETTAIQWPRRAGKTTAIWCWLIGYCEEVDDALIMTTAQSGTKARDRFMSVLRQLERYWPEDDGGPRLYKGTGHESFDFVNGARLWVVAPKEGSARGDAADVVMADEQGELDAEHSYDLKAGALPLLDTRPNGQVILAGTPGKNRAGWYWDALQAGLEGKAGHTASVHSADEEDDTEDEAVWKRVHPGIGTLTTLDKMRARRESMSAGQWAREYMGLWPGSSDKRAIPEDAWEEGEVERPAARPERFGLAFDVSPDSSVAALVVAWRIEGEAYIELIEYGDPRQVGREALRISRKYRVPIGYDDIGANLEIAGALERAKPKPKLQPFGMRDMYEAASNLVRAIKERELLHPGQPDMNDAAEAVAWRVIGDGAQLFARRASSGDITPIVGASSALLMFDRSPQPQKARIHVRQSA